ncbi:PREDICTED: homocysteine S-methyltransferase 1-like [Rhagoletis zephyria]|uniref:homocysteine S-methyltransferase 1-like n=1 Tax=Rhagoletis zephyria TaxID=28612 RepID=UPI000811638A|nr:PREDICTED: homocysteine S-methyltransferase 1-like [Rhagoletis zephyria]
MLPTQQILVKCGGFSTQLARHVQEKIDGDPLWGSRFDQKNPTAVVQTHLDFLQNGAQIILSNTYQSSIEGFMEHLSLSREESIQLMRKSVQLAKEAKMKYFEMVEKANGTQEAGLPLIMASIGPYGAHLHDCSEYKGSYSKRVSSEDIQNWHRPRIDACLAEGVDGLAIETIPCQMEAEAVVDMLLNDYPNVKFWVSFQCKDAETLAHGELFSNAAYSIWNKVKNANAVERLIAVGVNCLNPMFVKPLFKSLNILAGAEYIPLVVYSNRGEIYDEKQGEWTERDDCIPLDSYVPQWIELGARIIGGCCRVYPEDILRIRKCIDNLGNNN